MEHKFYTDDFERLLKEKSDEFRMYPSKRVWHSVYNNLHPDRKWPSIAVTLTLVAVLFLIGYWNNNNNAPSSNLVAQQRHTAATKNTTTITDITYVTAPAGNTNSSADEKKSDIAAAITNTSNQPNTNPGVSKLSTVNENKNLINTLTAGKNKLSVAKQIDNNTANNSTQLASPTAEAAIGLPQANTQVENNHGLNNLAIDNTAFNSSTVTATNEKNGNTVFIEPIITDEKNNSSSDIASTNTTALQATAKETADNTTKNKLSSQDKSWIEHYAMYNKTTRKKWKGRLSSEVYITPGVSMRHFYSNTSVKFSATPAAVNMPGAVTAIPAYKPGLSFQTGAGFSYAVSKNIRLKSGIQASFTSYAIPVTDINHPVLTTLTLNNPVSGYPYIEARASTIANVPGHNNKKIHNQTSQISIPVGMALKLGGNDKLQWYAGGSVQPTFVLGGKAYLISSDNNNYVSDASMLRKWNVNGAAETYIQYKMSGFTLQAGPELRYQFISTYSSKYSNSEKLYNVGVKVGIVKNL